MEFFREYLEFSIAKDCPATATQFGKVEIIEVSRDKIPRMAISAFDLFKIGIGPSSSHTVGPMRAAAMFAGRLREAGVLREVVRVKAEMYGSLGATGRGHGTPKAVMLGLEGENPESVDVEAIAGRVEAIRSRRSLRLNGEHPIAFDEKEDLRLNRRKVLPLHPNGMIFTAWRTAQRELLVGTYYSVGGGFVLDDSIPAAARLPKTIARFAIHSRPRPSCSRIAMLRIRAYRP